MKQKILQLQNLLFSGTAKDTLVLFVGNVGSAFWGFLYTLIVARSLSIYDFGVFSAVLNLVIILSSLADIGISTGSVSFVAENIAKGDENKANEYIKASFVVRLILVLILAVLIVVFAPFVASKLLAGGEINMSFWTALLLLFIFPVSFFQFILQAQKKFLQATIYDNSFYVGRLVFAFAFYMLGTLTLDKSYWAYAIGFGVTVLLTFIFLGTHFISTKPGKIEYKNLLKFSGWIAINRMVSSISGKLDVQMLATMAGAVATGFYSIPSRLASFIAVLAGSFSSVLATRLASFGDREKEKKYIIKSLLAILPIAAGIVVWIIIAKPFMIILFGEKYLPAVPIFQALAASQIPFLFTAPATSAIIYSMKKTVYIGTLSFVQLAAIFVLNFVLIPKYGVFGPTITFGITNTLLALYMWYRVIQYYWIKKEN